jgi:SAM-dependent methyltransferase
MLARARAKAPGASIVQADARWLPFAGGFDAAVCLFDSLNYLLTPADLGYAAVGLRRALEPGGVLVFDVNTRYKLEHVFGSSKYGEDRGDFAYVWENQFDDAAATCRFDISLFLARGSTFERHREIHHQAAHSDEVITETFGAAGFGSIRRFDDFTASSPSPTSLRVTWAMTVLG